MAKNSDIKTTNNDQNMNLARLSFISGGNAKMSQKLPKTMWTLVKKIKAEQFISKCFKN